MAFLYHMSNFLHCQNIDAIFELYAALQSIFVALHLQNDYHQATRNRM